MSSWGMFKKKEPSTEFQTLMPEVSEPMSYLLSLDSKKLETLKNEINEKIINKVDSQGAISPQEIKLADNSFLAANALVTLAIKDKMGFKGGKKSRRHRSGKKRRHTRRH